MKEKIVIFLLLLGVCCFNSLEAKPKKNKNVIEYKTDKRIPELVSKFKLPDAKIEAKPVYTKRIIILDDDGDGIDDRFDRCPTIPGIAELKGCPDIDMKKMITVGHHSVILTDEEFANAVKAFSDISFKGTKMLPKSNAGLDKFASMMKSNKKWIITISSYVDESDDQASNLNLSRTRLKTVQNYLVRKGIPLKRIRGEYFGDTMPVLDLPKTRFEVEISQ